jgi:hypothetical protein
MDERRTPEAEQAKRHSAVLVVAGVLAAVAMVAALYVVARSLRLVKPEPIPAALRTAPPDTGLVNFRASMRRKARTLQVRCRTTRKQFRDGLTPHQDSLSRDCDSAIALFLTHVAALDSVKREGRKAAADSLKAEYVRVKARVNVFTRSGRRSGEISDDSLDQELKKLISE